MSRGTSPESLHLKGQIARKVHLSDDIVEVQCHWRRRSTNWHRITSVLPAVPVNSSNPRGQLKKKRVLEMKHSCSECHRPLGLKAPAWWWTRKFCGWRCRAIYRARWWLHLRGRIVRLGFHPRNRPHTCAGSVAIPQRLDQLNMAAADQVSRSRFPLRIHVFVPAVIRGHPAASRSQRSTMFSSAPYSSSVEAASCCGNAPGARIFSAQAGELRRWWLGRWLPRDAHRRIGLR